MPKASVDIRVKGLRELEKSLRELTPQIQGKKGFAKNPLRTAARKGADVITNKAMENVRRHDNPETDHRIYEGIGRGPIPVRERDEFTNRGDSIEGYNIGLMSSRGKNKELSGKNSYNKTYWQGIFLELGTPTTPAKPFLRPALETEKTKAIAAFSESLDKSLQTIVKKLKRQARIK